RLPTSTRTLAAISRVWTELDFDRDREGRSKQSPFQSGTDDRLPRTSTGSRKSTCPIPIGETANLGGLKPSQTVTWMDTPSSKDNSIYGSEVQGVMILFRLKLVASSSRRMPPPKGSLESRTAP